MSEVLSGISFTSGLISMDIPDQLPKFRTETRWESRKILEVSCSHTIDHWSCSMETTFELPTTWSASIVSFSRFSLPELPACWKDTQVFCHIEVPKAARQDNPNQRTRTCIRFLNHFNQQCLSCYDRFSYRHSDLHNSNPNPQTSESKPNTMWQRQCQQINNSFGM